MSVNGSLNTINDDDEKDIRSPCANMHQVETVIARTIDALDELFPNLEASQLGGWHSANIRPNLERWIYRAGHLSQRLDKRAAKGRRIELFGCGSH